MYLAWYKPNTSSWTEQPLTVLSEHLSEQASTCQLRYKFGWHTRATVSGRQGQGSSWDWSLKWRMDFILLYKCNITNNCYLMQMKDTENMKAWTPFSSPSWLSKHNFCCFSRNVDKPCIRYMCYLFPSSILLLSSSFYALRKDVKSYEMTNSLTLLWNEQSQTIQHHFPNAHTIISSKQRPRSL